MSNKEVCPFCLNAHSYIPTEDELFAGDILHDGNDFFFEREFSDLQCQWTSGITYPFKIKEHFIFAAAGKVKAASLSTSGVGAKQM